MNISVKNKSILINLASSKQDVQVNDSQVTSNNYVDPLLQSSRGSNINSSNFLREDKFTSILSLELENETILAIEVGMIFDQISLCKYFLEQGSLYLLKFLIDTLKISRDNLNLAWFSALE